MIVVGDGTDRIGYTVGGSDAVGLPYASQYIFFKLDTSDAAANPGTADQDHRVFAGTEANLNFSAITIVGFGSLHNAKAQGNVPNVFIDNIRYIANDSYAATITGGTVGTPETMADVVGDDETVGAGMFSNPLGSSYYIFAPTEWGDDGTASSYFEGTDEQWFLLGDNGGGRSVGATHFPMRVVGNATGTNSFELTRVTIVNVGTRSEIDLSNADVDTLNLTGVVFTDTGTVTFPANSATKDMVDLIFNNCDQVYFSTVDVNGATFNGSNDALGAVLWDANSNEENQDNLIFNSDGTGHAIEISLNTAALTTFNIDGYEVSGYETADDGTTGNTVFLVDNAADGDVTINVTNGVGTFSYERAAGYTGTVTINQTVTVTVTAQEADGTPIQDARVFLEEDPGGTDIIDPGTLTNASGQVSVSYTGSTPQAVTGFVRKGTETPTYKTFTINDTIGAGGLSVTAVLTPDD